MPPLLTSALLGIAWTPSGIGSLSWSEADRFTGTLSGEFDGWLRPPLTFHAGAVFGRTALVGGIASVWFRDAQYADTSSAQTVGSIRFSLDGRYYFRSREAGRVNGWGGGGGCYILPFASDVSDAYSAAEQEDADEAARGTRARIGGGGGQLGVGAEYLFGDKSGDPAVALGVRYLGRLYVGEQIEEDGWRATTSWLTEAAVTVEFFL